MATGGLGISILQENKVNRAFAPDFPSIPAFFA